MCLVSVENFISNLSTYVSTAYFICYFSISIPDLPFQQPRCLYPFFFSYFIHILYDEREKQSFKKQNNT